VDRSTQEAESTSTQIHLKIDNEDQNKRVCAFEMCVCATSGLPMYEKYEASSLMPIRTESVTLT
jgi:hypothetical protein